MFKLIRDSVNIPQDFPASVVTLGNFDGVHRGHQQLILHLIEKAKFFNLPSVVVIFEPQPLEFFLNKNVPPRLMRLREKVQQLKLLGIDYVVCLRFNEKLARLPASDFVRKILVERLKAHYILIGDDFHFGYKRTGDLQLLQQWGKKLQFTAEAMQTHQLEGERVSSSRIRAALLKGDLPTAERLLGRPYGISGSVAHGEKLGRVLGFPTANIFPHRKVVPVEGIFVVNTYGLGSSPIAGVANVGNRPTVDGSGRTLLEVFLFNFDQTIYGRRIYVEFLCKLRDEERYDSLELLRQQMAKDVENAKAYFSNLHSPLPLTEEGKHSK